MEAKKLKFMHNWNNKLNCDYYTTIRLIQNGNDKYWRKNDILDVYIKETFLHNAEIIDIMKCDLKSIPNYLLLTDSKMNQKQFIEFCSKVYKLTAEQLVNEVFIILLIKKITK